MDVLVILICATRQKSNASPTKNYPEGQYVWMIGPTAEKKADKPPILRNMGGFYSEDDCLNPAICKNWARINFFKSCFQHLFILNSGSRLRAHFQKETINPKKYAFHENEGKKGFWDDAGIGFKLTHIKQPKHIYISTGELRRSVRAAFQQQTSYTSPKEFLEARKEGLKSKHLMELRKLSAVGLYREHERTLNGKIVYEQILAEDSPEEPYLIQWVSNPCGKYEWIIQRGWDNWNGESICLSNYIFKGRRPNRPLYMTTEEHRWPTKISEFRWKLFDETKRGGSFVKAAWETTEKDIQGNETTIRHGLKFQEIEIPDLISIEHATHGGKYTLGSALFNGRYYWRRANEKTGYLHWSQNRDRELVWSLSDKLGQVGNCTSYDDAWTPADMINWRLEIGPETKTVNLSVPTRERLLRIEHL
ncbi:unnamed protein product [Oikopleura dioica]|uniref:Uncharacterized protein n=1 Tax=Oikopleura dioica TaxID=34765 RepID=E4XNY9_OIKDI|nr:unnamed protein product [Oikopleura dioica]